MKAFMMFKDRDFDPQQILMKRERKPRAWETDERLSLQQLLPWNEKDLVLDLGLDIVINSMGKDDNFLLEVARVALLSGLTDTGTIIYRQQILKDCLENELVVREIYQITVDAIEREKNSYWSLFSRYPSGTLHKAVDSLEMFVTMLEKLRNIADQNTDKFNSEGFRRLFEMFRVELTDEYFEKIEEHLRELKFRNGLLISAELGQGNKGTNYVLHQTPEDKRNWFFRLLSQNPPGYTFQVHPRDEAGARALSELRDRGVNLVANALAQSTDHILSFFEAMRTELAFYIGCLNLHQLLTEIQEPVCFPVPVNEERRTLSFSDLYDVSLSLSRKQKIVGNKLNADGKDLIIITGANTGGKSTFLRSLGLAQLMIQAGMFVSAESFTAEVRDGIVTHFKREEDIKMESGKLDEELSRMSEIVDKISTRSLVLFNESFAATNEIEGSEIAKQITNALINSGIKVIFVSHLYEFAHSFYEKKMQNVVFLRAERLDDGTRTFRVVEGKPLQTSYGEDLYNTIFRQ